MTPGGAEGAVEGRAACVSFSWVSVWTGREVVSAPLSLALEVVLTGAKCPVKQQAWEESQVSEPLCS